MTALTFAGWPLAAVLAAIAARLRATARVQAERIARASHELRGPLHTAGLALHAASRGSGLAAVEIELSRVALAIADLEGEDSYRDSARADLTTLIRRQAGGWEALARSCGRELRIHIPDTPLIAKGGADRISQVLGNLVANALEHGCGAVDVRLRALGADAVVVEIGDEGAGLPAALEVLVARPRAGHGRRGRGLSIASDIVKTLGGRISADRGLGKARLVVELPVPLA